MPDEDVVRGRTETLRQRFHQMHRTVLSAGATDGGGQIAAIFGREPRYPALQQSCDILQIVLHLGNIGEKLDDLRIFAGLAAEAGLPMRVGQTARVENE